MELMVQLHTNDPPCPQKGFFRFIPRKEEISCPRTRIGHLIMDTQYTASFWEHICRGIYFEIHFCGGRGGAKS